MGGFQTGDDDEVISRINVTPLVDIVLVLLIIFMVTASYIVQAHIKVDLPRAASGETDVETTLNFQVRRDGTYLLDGEPRTLEAIAGRVERAVDDDPRTRAVIAADRRVEYWRVIELIDTIKSHGLEQFALNIEREANPR